MGAAPSHNRGDEDPVWRVLAVSRAVWEWVVAPGWLLGAAAPTAGTREAEEAADEAAAVALYRVAGGLFPLVPRACSLAAELLPRESRHFRLQCAAWARAPSCIRWISSRQYADYGSPQPARNKKVCVSILTGLLCGGHVDLAVGLVNGTDSTWNQCGVRWPAAPGSPEDIDIREDLKGSNWYRSKLFRFSGTPVESVKWVLEWLGMKQPWELWQMVQAAILFGNVPVTQWMVMEFGLAKPLADFCCIADHCARGSCPMLLKWWIENFSFPEAEDKKSVFSCLVCNENSSVELCQWVQKQLDISGDLSLSFLALSRNPHCMRWVIEEFPISPTASRLHYIFRLTSNFETVKWLVTERSVTPTLRTCFSACDCPDDNVDFVKWLSQRVTLSPKDHQTLLQRALACSNIGIAEWLESTFNIMNLINSTGAAGANFIDILGTMSSDSTLNGVKWFLQRVDMAQILTAARKAILEVYNIKAIFFVLEELHISVEDTELRHHVLEAVLHGSIYDVKRLQSMVTLSADDVNSSWASDMYICSSKNIKWLVSHLNANHLNNPDRHVQLIDCPLERDKSHCLMWLIETFDIQLSEVLSSSFLVQNVGLSMWKQLMNKFSPDPKTVRSDQFMRVATCRPAIAMWSMSRFSLTRNEVTEYLRRAPHVSPHTELWLHANP
ncbi:hypothetical protein Pelo_3625 [Pelomyxa schiedti]|nr:hypothetical protein Pelo_3625 [Pelomyxa schiedti]